MRITLCLLAGMVALALWVSLRSAQGYAYQNRAAIRAPASLQLPAGTDELGRDRAVRLAFAVLLSLGGACAASALASSLSLASSLAASLAHSWVRAVFLYGSDLCLTLPWLFLLMSIRSALPLNIQPLHSFTLTFLLLALLGAPAFFRLHLQRATSLLNSDWFLQASASGLRPSQLGAALLPHLRQLFWLQFLLFTPACLIAEANLGILGLGLAQPLPSLGSFLASLQTDMLQESSWLTYLPVAVLLTMLILLELLIFGEQT